MDKNLSNLSNITTLSLTYDIQKDIKLESSVTNLKELSLYSFSDLELPCSVLLNLEILELSCIEGLKFISEEENISLNNLKNLYINQIIISKRQDNIHIETKNLKFLDIQLGRTDNIDERFSVRNSDECLTINFLYEIFDFNFITSFIYDTFYLNSAYIYLDTSSGIEEIKSKSSNIFNEKNLKNLEYFNLSITNEQIMSGGSREVFYFIIAKYLFAKTKGDKYLFKSDIRIIDKDEEFYEYEIINTETRLCNGINYNDYHYINNKTVLGGLEKDIPTEKKENIFNNINIIEFTDGEEEIENYTSGRGFKPFLILI